LNPDTVTLNSGITVKLLGIKVNEEKKNEAIEFLTNKTRKQRVFMKFDPVKHDDNGNLLCYLYLKNRTFINAHLIKSALVNVDGSISYKRLKLFKKYQEASIKV